MTVKKMTKFGQKLTGAVGILVAGMGLIWGTSSVSADTYADASATNTIESYTSFILNGGPVEDIEKAFCRLRDLDQEAAQNVAQQYETAPDVASVSLTSCSTTGLARLVII